jgi:hypothetical protein
MLPRDPRTRIGLAFGGGLVLLAVLFSLLNALAPSPAGPRSSSYATSPGGVAAYAAVLRRSGHPVRRLRAPITDRAPRADETLFVLEPDVVEPDEARAIGEWVRSGGHLVAGGLGEWLGGVLTEAPAWAPTEPGRRRALTPVPGVRQVDSLDGGGWREVGGALPQLGPATAPLLVSVREGRGRVTVLADVSPLQNRGLARADNAALGIDLAGGAERPVAFLETVHGYGVARGFAGLPANVRWALIGLGLTALVAIWSVGRRFGPVEEPEVEPAPPRVAYVEALAAALERAESRTKERL